MYAMEKFGIFLEGCNCSDTVRSPSHVLLLHNQLDLSRFIKSILVSQKNETNQDVLLISSQLNLHVDLLHLL